LTPQAFHAVLVALLGLMLIFAFLAVRTRDLLAANIFLSMQSVALAAVFYVLQAPDIALTQVVIDAGVGTALLVIVVKKTLRFEEP